MAETQTGKLPKLGARIKQAAEQREAAPASAFRCQWCMVDLEPGVEVCPTCGSPGVDNAMIVPGLESATDTPSIDIAAKSDVELEEWWKDEEEELYKNSASTAGDQTPVIVGLLGTAVVCVAIGVFVAPMLLTSAFESSLGVTVENSNDLRPLGGLLGLLVGAFIGAIGMWVAAPRR